jgi:hypothetical protein
LPRTPNCEVAKEEGFRVNLKPRIADVVDIARSRLSDDEYHYALAAHLDFVLVRAWKRTSVC